MNIISGTFKDTTNTRTYTVTISSLDYHGAGYTITDVTDANFDDTEETILFTMDPVHITTDYSDTFAHNIVKTASVNLISNFNLRDLVLATNNNDIHMTITCGQESLFDGYVDPLCFSEPYARFWNEIEITANDKLASAQYIKYPQIVLSRMNEMMIFLDEGSNVAGAERGKGIINTIADAIDLEIDTTDFDSDILSAMRTTKITNTLFAGDSPDDWMTCFDVLEQIGRYWGVWFMQVGNKLKLIDWHGESRAASTSNGTQPKEDFIDDSTSISTADAYTQIKLSCDIDDADPIVEFGDDIVSPYPHYVKYMEELVTEGNGSNAQDLFKKLILNDETGSTEKHPSESYIYKNFCWVKKSKLWDFGANGYTQFLPDPDNNYSGTTQQYILNWLLNNPGKGAFVSFGRTDKMSLKDDSPINSIELQDGLIISICGHDGKNGYERNFNNTGPICSFTGTSKQFTPSDSNTTNYLIISGKILLNKMYAKSGREMHYDYDRSKKSGKDYDEANGCLYDDYQNTYEALYTLANDPHWWDWTMYHNAVPRIGSNDYGCFYTQRYYDGNAGSESAGALGNSAPACICGDLKQDKYQKTWKYEYSYIDNKGKAVDNTSKIPILRCQLKIGDKYCVERMDLGSEGWGRFEWLTEEEIISKNIRVNNTYWYDLTIGINPKIDDYIIGQNYDIQNTIWYYDDVDGTGTAIPIRLSDNLAGEVKFTIKQPMYSYWEDAAQGPRILSWLFGGSGTYPILEKLESIILSGFKIELTSDKGHIMNNTENNDLVYASNENDEYIEEHEDDVNMATMITSTEASDWGVEMVISDSHVVNTDNSPFYGFEYNTGEFDENYNPIMAYIKPEQLYVNNFYLEYSNARQIVETGLKIKNIDWIQNPDKYKFNFAFLEGEYVPIGYDANLKDNSIAFTMKDMTDLLED